MNEIRALFETAAETSLARVIIYMGYIVFVPHMIEVFKKIIEGDQNYDDR